MLKDFDEFFRFCFEHGGTLRNHKQFGEMARELRAQIEAAEKNMHPTLPSTQSAHVHYSSSYTTTGNGFICGECGKWVPTSQR